MTYGKGTQSEHRGHYLFDKDDLIKLKYLPAGWWYCLNHDGEGIAIDFPVKAKPILSWSQKKIIKKDGKLVKGAQFTIEKVCLTIIRKPCTLESIF